MKLEEAKEAAGYILGYLKPYTTQIEVVGSIRRQCAECNDVDVVLIPNDNFQKAVKELEKSIKKKGEKVIICEIDGVQYDLYICDKKNWDVIKLIRTGSQNHNKKLCQLAIRKGLKLKAGGEGLVDGKENVISTSEKGILENLLGKYIEPKDRI